MVGGLSALGAGLYSMGIPKDSILQYETAVKSGKYVLIAHGSDAETVHAREIISSTNPETLEAHQPAARKRARWPHKLRVFGAQFCMGSRIVAGNGRLKSIVAQLAPCYCGSHIHAPANSSPLKHFDYGP